MSLAELTSTVSLEMAGYTQTQEQAGYLTASASSSALTFSVNDASIFSHGIIEVEDELCYVSTIDKNTNTLTLAPFGRGYAATTPASHAVDVKVVNSPAFPRSAVKRALNECVSSLYPDLFQVASTTQVFTAGTTTYAFAPVGAGDIMDVTYQDPWSSEYVPIRRWKFDKYNHQLTVWDGIPTGYTLYVAYRAAPTIFTSDAALLTSTGLPDSCADLVRLGAVVRLLPFVEIPNSAIIAADASFAANARISTTSAATLARQLYQQFKLRVSEESARLLSQYPVRVHYTR